jgi:hypothetical protein
MTGSSSCPLQALLWYCSGTAERSCGNYAGVNAMVTCFTTLGRCGSHTKPLKTKSERGWQGCSGKHEIFTLTGRNRIYCLKTKINLNYN